MCFQELATWLCCSYNTVTIKIKHLLSIIILTALSSADVIVVRIEMAKASIYFYSEDYLYSLSCFIDL